jgi:repressor LexA
MQSKRQQEIYDFILRYSRRHGYPPTVREIGADVGLASPSTVHGHLAKLEQAGYLRRDPTKPRALELIGRQREPGESEQRVSVLPLVGQIAAGGPLLAEENIEDYVAVPEPLSRPENDEFLLRIKGESMRDAGILDSDYVVVRRQSSAENGEIVAALVGDDEAADEATVKRFFADTGRIRLEPENPDYSTIYADHVSILGKVTGVFRRL